MMGFVEESPAPIEDHLEAARLLVKRVDLAVPVSGDLSEQQMVEHARDQTLRTIEHADKRLLNKLTKSPWVISALHPLAAAGIAKGLKDMWTQPPLLIVHNPYKVASYQIQETVQRRAGAGAEDVVVVRTRHQAKGPTPPFPCSDLNLKAIRWWVHEGSRFGQQAVFWNG